MDNTESKENVREVFCGMAFGCLLTAINRQLAIQEDLFKVNGLFLDDYIVPLIGDYIEKLEHASLSTKLIQFFQQVIKSMPTYARLQDELNHRVSKAITVQLKQSKSQRPRSGKYSK